MTSAAAAAPVFALENILLLGSDSRAGANGSPGYSDISIDTTIDQSDTLMIAHVSADRQRVTILFDFPGPRAHAAPHRIGRPRSATTVAARDASQSWH